jgi:hypothetical protein
MENKCSTFLRALFNPGEATCYAKHPKGRSVFPIESPPKWVQFFSVNPIEPLVDHEPTKPYHAPDKPRRADHNCTAFRNFLIEIDSIPLDEQLKYVSDLGLPFSTCTYSGGKSYHFVVALEETFNGRQEYDYYATWLHNIVQLADHSARNPSRLSRFPGVIRVDKNKEQSLICVPGRVPNEVFYDWLNANDWAQPAPPEKRAEVLIPGVLGRLSMATESYLMFGADKGFQNNALYSTKRPVTSTSRATLSRLIWKRHS